MNSTRTQPIAIILAAGKGTRMGSDLPKVMHRAAGRPLVEWVVDACREAGCGRIILVVGHGADSVRAHFAGAPGIEFVTQSPQLGTGHAVDQARAALLQLDPASEVLVLCGDGALIRAATLHAILDAHRASAAAATLATSVLPDPSTYGRIERDAAGGFRRIVEEKDATPAHLAIHEVNPSYYCFAAGPLRDFLRKLENRNASGEYYITDLFALLLAAGQRVHVVDAVPPEEVLSVNTPAQLAEVESCLLARRACPKEVAR